jgi:hypothetical protein
MSSTPVISPSVNTPSSMFAAETQEMQNFFASLVTYDKPLTFSTK